MSRPRKTVPKYSHHKPSGRAYVRVPDGPGRRRVIYLGAFGTPESRDAYALEIANLSKQEAAIQAAIAGGHPTASRIPAGRTARPPENWTNSSS